jgi:hypothetical protein
MAKWPDYWATQGSSIKRGVSQWKQNRQARVEIRGLKKTAERANTGNLYSHVTITQNGLRPRSGGKNHILALADEIRLFRLSESVTVQIVQGNDEIDYLDFS